jgi:lactoylglutathione lyase
MRYRFRYTGIRVRDLERSLAFYTGALGMKEIARGEMPHGGLYVHLRTPRSPQRLELNWYPEGSRFFSPYREGQEMDHLAFVVDDVGKAYKELVAKGAEPAVTPAEAKGVTEVYVKDPDGIWIELLS